LGEFWRQDDGRAKAKKLLKNFNFPVTKRIAQERFYKLDNLLKEIEKEIRGCDIDRTH
jgi:hypothetical protein